MKPTTPTLVPTVWWGRGCDVTPSWDLEMNHVLSTPGPLYDGCLILRLHHLWGLGPFRCWRPRITCRRIMESAGWFSCSSLTCGWFRGHYGEVRAWHLHRDQKLFCLSFRILWFELHTPLSASVGLHLFLFPLSIVTETLLTRSHFFLQPFLLVHRKQCFSTKGRKARVQDVILNQRFMVIQILVCVSWSVSCNIPCPSSAYLSPTSTSSLCFTNPPLPFFVSSESFQSSLFACRPSPHPPHLTHPSVCLWAHNPTGPLSPAPLPGPN